MKYFLFCVSSFIAVVVFAVFDASCDVMPINNDTSTAWKLLMTYTMICLTIGILVLANSKIVLINSFLKIRLIHHHSHGMIEAAINSTSVYNIVLLLIIRIKCLLELKKLWCIEVSWYIFTIITNDEVEILLTNFKKN